MAVSSGSRQAKTDSESTLEEPNKEFLVWEREVREGRRDQSNETSYQILMELMADDKWGEEDDRDRAKVDVVKDTISLVDGHLEEPLCWGHKFLHNFENWS